MHLARYIAGLRRGTAMAGLAVMLGVVTVTLSQCRMVDERLTGVGLERANPDKCFQGCAKVFADSVQAEAVIHVGAVHDCAGDSLCLAMEEIRHEQAIARFQAAARVCRDNCHHQGRGGGGR